MDKEKENTECCYDHKRWKQHHWHKAGGGTGSALYFFGFIGAAIFFIGKATTFWMGVLGILKALVWPAFLVYEFLKFFAVK